MISPNHNINIDISALMYKITIFDIINSHYIEFSNTLVNVWIGSNIQLIYRITDRV